MSDWKYIDNCVIAPDIHFVHCDTRDFHILCVDGDRAETLKNIRRTIGYGTLSDCKITREEILPMLKDLETRSGGKGHWRHITTKSCSDWIKYIRFVKDDDSKYIIYRMLGDRIYPLSKNTLAEPINQEHLNHM